MSNSDSPTTTPKRKASSVRHTRAVAYDRIKRPATIPPAPEIEQRLTEIVQPATYAQLNLFRDMGLRERTLTLPVMMALVLSMIWRQIASVSELVRTVQRQSLLWVTPRKLTQQALSQRLDTLPADLFRRVLEHLLPQMQERWAARRRPVPPEVAWAEAHYIDLMPHNPLGPICTAATVHLAAAVANFAWLEVRVSPTENLGFDDSERRVVHQLVENTSVSSSRSSGAGLHALS